jgi:hypothetical protein
MYIPIGAIAMPVTPPKIPQSGYRVFDNVLTPFWSESSNNLFSQEHVDFLVRQWSVKNLYDPNDWYWTTFLYFPEMYPPDIIQDYLEFGYVQRLIL